MTPPPVDGWTDPVTASLFSQLTVLGRKAKDGVNHGVNERPLAAPSTRGQMWRHMPLLLDICWWNYQSASRSLAKKKKKN